MYQQKKGTAGFANVKGYEIGGKTGTADQPSMGGYSKKKVNTFASVFPTSDPKFVLAVMLDEPKANREFVYHYRDDRYPYKGNWRNTAGWTTVWVAGQIIEKIGPILAKNIKSVNDVVLKDYFPNLHKKYHKLSFKRIFNSKK